MNYLVKNLLRGGIFAAAAVAAFAFTQPMEVVQAFGYDASEEEWVEVTVGSSEYDCDDTQSSEACLYDEPDGDPIPNSPEGEFIPLP